MTDRKALLQAVNGFIQKTDGRDKLTATLQYLCMFVSAGNPGMAKDIQTKIAAARKVFRILRPLETLTPLLNDPYLAGKQHPVLELLPKLKSLLMTIYFGGDHIVWLGSVGIVQDKALLERAQKASLWGWFFGSLCTVAQEGVALTTTVTARQELETDAEWAARKQIASDAAQKRALVFVHALIQGLLAMGLLQLRPWKPRTVGFLGIVASAMNCYMLFPALPARKALPAPSPELKVAAKTA